VGGLADAGQFIVRAMVLAAGVGSRLEPLTTQTPKPLVPIANVPVMEHILKLLKRHEFADICANVHYLPDQIKDYFEDGSRLGINLHFLEEKELSGDAGGVRACRDFLSGTTFVVLMGDLLTDADLTEIVRQHKKKKALASIGLKRVREVSHFGIAVLDQAGLITAFQEKPQAHEAKSDLASTGIYILEPEVFNYIPDKGSYGFGRQLFPSLVEKGFPVLGVEIEGYWSDVGTLTQYRQANFDTLAGLVHLDVPGHVKMSPDHLHSKVWLEEGAIIEPNVVIEGPALIGKNSIVRSGAHLSGSVVIGENCIIQEGARIQNSILWSGAQVKSRAEIIDTILGKNVQIESGKIYTGVAAVPESSSEQVALM
jgi:mannose-1-phosphate guanylyltransferase/phosphomannomutase